MDDGQRKGKSETKMTVLDQLGPQKGHYNGKAVARMMDIEKEIP